ncbi:MAG: hypothetical protein ACYTBJ_00020 [Planctomycetota bacterium]|jgi:hypothetical protein
MERSTRTKILTQGRELQRSLSEYLEAVDCSLTGALHKEASALSDLCKLRARLRSVEAELNNCREELELLKASDTCKHGAEWEYFEIFDEAGSPLETDRRLCMSCRAESAESERDELRAKLEAMRERLDRAILDTCEDLQDDSVRYNNLEGDIEELLRDLAATQ